MRDILIVEDGIHERERLEKLFNSANYTVSTAESVEEAEKLLKLDRFRLAFLDIGLGDKSGSHLFQLMKRSAAIPYIIILTGNPSVHLKQRFLDEGAAAYIVKASAAAENDALIEAVRSLLGTTDVQAITGIPLGDFLRGYVDPSSQEFFLDTDGKIPPCSHCGSMELLVSFSHKPQLPPRVEGKVVCANCGQEMDPKVG